MTLEALIKELRNILDKETGKFEVKMSRMLKPGEAVSRVEIGENYLTGDGQVVLGPAWKLSEQEIFDNYNQDLAELRQRTDLNQIEFMVRFNAISCNLALELQKSRGEVR